LEANDNAVHLVITLFMYWLKKQLRTRGIEQSRAETEVELFRMWVNKKLAPNYQLYNFGEGVHSGKCIAGLADTLRPGEYT
jgi:hypothetical protein